MKIQLVFTIGLSLLFAFQSVVGQGSISADAQSYLDEFATLKNDIEKGSYTHSDFEKAYDSRAKYVKWALSKEDRQSFLNQRWLTDIERKKMSESLDLIAKSAQKKGVGAAKEESGDLGFDPVFTPLLESLDKVITQVQVYDPKKHAFIVNTHDQEWLVKAISAKTRNEWAGSYFGSMVQWRDQFLKKLTSLENIAKTKIPSFKPNPKNFANHNATHEALMKKQLDDPSKVKIHQIGLAQATWSIQKNEITDVPQKRYMAGYIWGKDSNDDFPYCRMYQVNIIQDYEGGGKYGESYAVYIDTWVVGCP